MDKFKNKRVNKDQRADNDQRTDSDQRTDIIFGKNAVKEALRSGRPIDYVMIAQGEGKTSLAPIVAQCRKAKLLIKEVSPKKLDFTCGHQNHQGVILVVAAKAYSSLDDILSLAKERGEKPFIVICDSLEDPHNLGAIIRTAEAAGAHGVIIPERRSVSLSGIVSKVSAGAIEYLHIARVKNINDTLKSLKEEGVWIFASDMAGEDYQKLDFDMPIALIIGSEGRGVSRLVKENSDVLVSIPMFGEINSLNASVAGGILMFAIANHHKNI